MSPIPDSRTHADLVGDWIRGWALCKQTRPPQAVDGGWRVEVGWPEQRARLVFPALCDGLVEAAAEIDEPWTYLKVCAPVEALRPLLPPRWVAESRGYMMTVDVLADTPARLPPGYWLAREQEGAVALARVLTDAGELAAAGRVARSGGFAVFDRIVTEEGHRRRGLATAVMRTLAADGLRQGASRGLLVGTEMGRQLYQALGWRVHAPYASAVIPGG
jgi:GNAT superfamily N-acetyltransferase